MYLVASARVQKGTVPSLSEAAEAQDVSWLITEDLTMSLTVPYRHMANQQWLSLANF